MGGKVAESTGMQKPESRIQEKDRVPFYKCSPVNLPTKMWIKYSFLFLLLR
jgi:hypothetical protein